MYKSVIDIRGEVAMAKYNFCVGAKSFIHNLSCANDARTQAGTLEPSALSCRVVAAYVPLRATSSESVPAANCIDCTA
jgi:hypothetical protein